MNRPYLRRMPESFSLASWHPQRYDTLYDDSASALPSSLEAYRHLFGSRTNTAHRHAANASDIAGPQSLAHSGLAASTQNLDEELQRAQSDKDELSQSHQGLETSLAVYEAIEQLRRANEQFELRKAERQRQRELTEMEGDTTTMDATRVPIVVPASDSDMSGPASTSPDSPTGEDRATPAELTAGPSTDKIGTERPEVEMQRQDLSCMDETSQDALILGGGDHANTHVSQTLAPHASEQSRCQAPVADHEVVSTGTDNAEPQLQVASNPQEPEARDNIDHDIMSTPEPRPPISRLRLENSQVIETRLEVSTPLSARYARKSFASPASALGELAASAAALFIDQEMEQAQISLRDTTVEQTTSPDQLESKQLHESKSKRSKLLTPPRSTRSSRLLRTFLEKKLLAGKLASTAPFWSTAADTKSLEEFASKSGGLQPTTSRFALSGSDTAGSASSLHDGAQPTDLPQHLAQHRDLARRRATETVTARIFDAGKEMINRAQEYAQRARAQQIVERMSASLHDAGDVRTVIKLVHNCIKKETQELGLNQVLREPAHALLSTSADSKAGTMQVRRERLKSAVHTTPARIPSQTSPTRHPSMVSALHALGRISAGEVPPEPSSIVQSTRMQHLQCAGSFSPTAAQPRQRSASTTTATISSTPSKPGLGTKQPGQVPSIHKLRGYFAREYILRHHPEVLVKTSEHRPLSMPTPSEGKLEERRGRGLVEADLNFDSDFETTGLDQDASAIRGELYWESDNDSDHGA